MAHRNMFFYQKIFPKSKCFPALNFATVQGNTPRTARIGADQFDSNVRNILSAFLNQTCFFLGKICFGPIGIPHSPSLIQCDNLLVIQGVLAPAPGSNASASHQKYRKTHTHTHMYIIYIYIPASSKGCKILDPCLIIAPWIRESEKYLRGKSDDF